MYTLLTQAWSYFTKFDADAKELDLTTDAKYAGNYHRFVNHDIKNQNVRAIVTPCRNRWYVIYVSSKPIPKDTELLTSYGAAYFDTR